MDARTRLDRPRRVARGLQAGLARARQATLIVHEPTAREIQIDLDSVRALHTFSRQWRMLDARDVLRGWRAKFSPSFSKGHLHVTITLPRARPLRERVLLAALLGSDLKREGFNYIRVVTRRSVPVAFFEKRK